MIKIQLIDLLDRNREPFFICIGSSKNILDSVANRVGTKLSNAGFKTLGTLDDPLHNLNLKERTEKEIDTIDTTLYQVIGVDCMLDNQYGNKDKIFVENNPIYPGRALDRKLKPVGEICIGINVGYSYNDWEDCLADMIMNKGNIEDVNHLASETFRYIMNTLTEIERERRDEREAL